MRPVLLFCCHPLTGHFTPVFRVAAGLRQRGWRVAFLSSEFFRPRIEAAGLQFLPLLGSSALDDASLFDRSEAGVALAEGLSVDAAAKLPQSVTDSRHQALMALPGEWDSLKAALETLAGQNPGEKIFLVSEAFFYGAMPLKYGAPLPSAAAAALLPRSVCVSITAPAIRSVDLPPFGHPAQFDPSAAGRERRAEIWDEWLVQAAPLTELQQRKTREAGATDLGGISTMVFMGGANYVCHNAIAQIGVPQFEYPRSDFPPGFRIVGIVPPVMPSAPPDFPWWHELVANASSATARKKKVVAVAQGTVETEPTELILPTLRLLGARDDVITVAILGVRGAKIASDTPLPANARVADYLSYDALLPFADLWIHNGGYGATMHGIAHGVPMVIAGDTQDKPENGKRVQFSGLGIDLATARPDLEQLKGAIYTVLADPKFSQTAKAMQEEARRMDCFGNVEKLILEQIEKDE